MRNDEITGPLTRNRPARSPGTFVVRRCATGLGLFATRRIGADRRLLEYSGPQLTEAQARRRGGRYLIEIGDGRYIDGSGRDNLARYINHSCAANCAYVLTRNRVWIWSLRAIEADEELTADYGAEYVARLLNKTGCLCPSCRTVDGAR